MINKLHLTNYQSHKDTELEFHPGVNVIIGPSDAGKSAILRALIWNLFNRPLGDGFRSHWNKDTSVQIEFNDHNITRSKIKTTNHYIIDGQSLKAFGQEVPVEVLDAHNLDRTLNIQTQIDPFFLLQSSPGEVAKYFNQIAGLESIDKLNKNLSSHHRKVRQDIASTKTHLFNLNENLEEYADLDNIGELITQAEQTKTDLDQAINYKQYLSSQLSRIKTAKTRLKDAKEKLRVKGPLEQALALYDQLGIINQQISAWTRLKNRMEGHIVSLDKSRSRLTEMKTQFHELMPESCPLCGQEVKK